MLDEIKYDLVPYTRGRGFQISEETPPAFPHFMLSGQGFVDLIAAQKLDFVFALEEPDDGLKSLREWWSKIKHGGHLILWLPVKWFKEQIPDLMTHIPGWDLAVNEAQGRDGEEMKLLRVYRKLNSVVQEHSWKTPRPIKSAAVVRYGGLGDVIMASSILPGLKDRGYHVTFFTNPAGHDLLMADPHVDRFIVQDRDQVPPEELGAFWYHWQQKFNKFINLSESMEVTWLAKSHRPNFHWPHNLRHKLLNVNYLEFLHELAEIPLPYRQKFYATPKEQAWAARERKKIPGPVIVWTLLGSAVHKAWPYLDAVIARLMLDRPELHVALVGDEFSQICEAGWENEPRVLKRSGIWSARQTMAFLEHADLVIGPETGTMNAAAFLDVPKIVIMSHSSVENLTRDWVNTISLIPEACECWPCHQMHYSYETCPPVGENGVARCQMGISAGAMLEAITYALHHEFGCSKFKEQAAE